MPSEAYNYGKLLGELEAFSGASIDRDQWLTDNVNEILSALSLAVDAGRCRDALTNMQSLSSWLGAGGLSSESVDDLNSRIRWGVDQQVSAAIQRCADKVEELSKVPSTRWGAVKAAILALQETDRG